MNRIDYCINFDVSELDFDCPSELKRKLPEIIMGLIKYSDVPNKFSVPEGYNGKFQFYLKSKSITINCYWKHDDLRRNFYDCTDLENSFNIICFEIQYRYPKAITVASQIKRQHKIRRSIAEGELKRQDTMNTVKRDYTSGTLQEKYGAYALSEEYCSNEADAV